MKGKAQSAKSKSRYVNDENSQLQRVVRELSTLVKETVPTSKQTVNAWGVPTFEAKNPFCFYMVGKNHVTFGFHFGTSLQDPEGLLEGTGKNIRHVKLRALEDVKRKGLKEMVAAAARYEGKPTRGMSGKQSRA